MRKPLACVGVARGFLLSGLVGDLVDGADAANEEDDPGNEGDFHFVSPSGCALGLFPLAMTLL